MCKKYETIKETFFKKNISFYKRDTDILSNKYIRPQDHEMIDLLIE